MGRYSFNARVRFSEVAEDQKLDLASVIDYFQDCSTFQSEDLGIGYDWLAAQGLAWLLVRWQIVLHRLPKLCEEIRVTTWPYRFSHALGSRNFILETAGGELLAEADSLWLLVRLDTGEPVRVSDDQVRLYAPIDPLDMDYAPRKIRLPKTEGKALEPFRVVSSNLDSNHHVNNGQYPKMAENYLPDGFEPGEVRIEYRKSALLGDLITPVVYDAGDEFFVDLTDAEGSTYAITHFIRRKTAEPQP
ncbi:MAG: acyl-[Lachnospiraceae bacterium]|nr:acyl-[acyl-carrier-protein] thioesterase [Lachnospiraceae bacterium]MBR0153921.1 acyl-[acyl-carrier-protein] thioesterase [Lachnospiraceae bacterium]